MDRAELNKQFKQLLESTVLPQNRPLDESRRLLRAIDDWVRSNIPERLFRFRCDNTYNVISFEHNTIQLCSADMFSDKFDSVVYVDKDRIRQDIQAGFTWKFQKFCIDAVQQTGHLPENIKNLYGTEVADSLKHLYTTMPEEEIRVGLESVKEQVLPKVLDNIYSVAVRQVNEARRDRAIKIACFTEDIGSSYMWDRYANGYKGFALEYDLRGSVIGAEVEDSDDALYPALYPVIYSDTKYDATEIASWNLVNDFCAITGTDAPPFPDLLHVYKQYLYKDGNGYSHEREWRLLCACKNMQDSDFLEITPGNSMKAIYYGPYIADDIKTHLRMLAKRHGIKEYDVELDDNNCGFALNIKPL